MEFDAIIKVIGGLTVTSVLVWIIIAHHKGLWFGKGEMDRVERDANREIIRLERELLDAHVQLERWRRTALEFAKLSGDYARFIDPQPLDLPDAHGADPDPGRIVLSPADGGAEPSADLPRRTPPPA